MTPWWQRLRVAHKQQVEMMDLERDRELDEEAAAVTKAKAKAKRESRARRRSSRPAVIGFMGKSRRPSLAAPSAQPADKPARKGRRSSLFGGRKAAGTVAVPLAQLTGTSAPRAFAAPVMESTSSGDGLLSRRSSLDSRLRRESISSSSQRQSSRSTRPSMDARLRASSASSSRDSAGDSARDSARDSISED